MKVTVGPLFGMSDSPLGKVEVEVPGVWRVDVHDDALPVGKLHVGMIGRQDGANFCENLEFRKFTPDQQAEIIAEVKKQHGSASVAEPMKLPDPVEPTDGELDDE